MPFVMTHLCIARNIARSLKIGELPAFYLGSLAPDSVHFRPNYNSDYKKVSHLCVGDEKWGECTNNQEWIENVLRFLDAGKACGNTDFLYGYCTHILSDIYNNIYSWTPFRLAHPEELKKGYGNAHHIESGLVDLRQYQTYAHSKEVFSLLTASKSVTLPGIINADEVDRMRENVLYSQYHDKTAPDITANRFVTMENQSNFIDDASDYVLEKLRG